jgi:hypothetical protein
VFIDVNTEVPDQPGREPELLKSLESPRPKPATRARRRTK